MKINLMPILAGVITISAMATPFAVQAQTQTPSQTPTQRTYQHHGKWDKLNLSDQQKAQMRQIHSDTRAQVEAVLTPQQRDQLNAARQNKQANQANQTHQGRHHFMTALNLTDAQKSRIKAIKQAQKTRMQAILIPAQRQQLQQMQQQRQQMRQQRQQQNSQ